MYRVYADDIIIYDDQFINDDTKLIDPKLTLQDSSAGSFTFTVLPNNPGYDAIQRFTTVITVKQKINNIYVELWSGRVIEEEEDFWKNRRFTCEGELAYLNDTLQLPHEYHDITVESFMQTLLDNHNEKVSDEKKFYVGYIDPNISLLPTEEEAEQLPEYILVTGTYDPNVDYFTPDGNGGWVQVYYTVTYLPGNPPIPVYPTLGDNIYIKNPEYVPANIPEYIVADKPYTLTEVQYYEVTQDNKYQKAELKPANANATDSAVVVLNNEIHRIGGDSVVVDNTYTYSTHEKWDGQKWVRVSYTPYIFGGGAAAVMNGEIHIFGGAWSSTTAVSNSRNHYKWDGKKWTKLADIPYNFISGCAITLNNEIHLLGGMNSSGTANKKHYKWNGSEWISVSTLPYAFALGAAVILIDGAIDILGGKDGKTKHYRWLSGGTTWKSVSTLPYQFYRGSAACVYNEIHLVGGYNNDLKHYIYTNSKWMEASELPYNFYDGQLAIINYSNKPNESKYIVHMLGGGHGMWIGTHTEFYIWYNLTWLQMQVCLDTDVLYVKNPDYDANKDKLYRYTNYETTLTCIIDKIVDRLGGHIKIRKQNGKKYIDYYKDYPTRSTQIVEFGLNLLDFTKNWDLTDFATVIIPLGAPIEHDDEWEGDEDHPAALTDYTTVETVNDGSRYVIAQEAFDRFGRIEKVVNWDDVTMPKNLLTKAKKYLSDYQFDKMSLVVSAVDLYFTNPNSEDSFDLLELVRVVSPPHGLDRYFPITKITISLDNPETTEYTFGEITESSLTSAINSNLKK